MIIDGYFKVPKDASVGELADVLQQILDFEQTAAWTLMRLGLEGAKAEGMRRLRSHDSSDVVVTEQTINANGTLDGIDAALAWGGLKEKIVARMESING